MRFGSRGPSEFATEMPWPRLRGKTPYMAMSTVVSEKNREMLFIGNVFYKQWHRCVLFHLCFEGTTSWKTQILIHSKEATLLLWKKISSPRERRKWSLVSNTLKYSAVIEMLFHIIERKWKCPIDERININFQLSQYLFSSIICN